MKGSEFVFDYVHLLHNKCHKINPNCCGSYMDSPGWIKSKKATINPIIKEDNKCFQHAVTVALNHKKIKNDQQRITKIKPFVNKYSWKGINFPSEKDDWKKFEKNDVIIALNVLYPFVSKHNSNPEKQVILLMLSNGKGWHYLSVKKLLALIKGIPSKHKSDFYCVSYLRSFRTKNKLESHKRVCENKDFCDIIVL